MSEILMPKEKPVLLFATHTGSTSEIAITNMVIDAVSTSAGYYKIKAGNKLRLHEFDLAAEEETRAYIEVCKNLETSTLVWIKVKGVKLSSKGHIGRSWRYPVIIEAYDYDHGVRFSFVQTSGGQIDVSAHGSVSPLS
jgi:hypothetical protein